MLKRTFFIACAAIGLAISTTLLSLPVPEHTNANNSTASRSLLIENADLFDGRDLLNNIDIEIIEGVITAVSENLSSDVKHRIDAEGKTIIPGLIDAHTHSFGSALQSALNFGVTTHVDMFTPAMALAEQTKLEDQGKHASLYLSLIHI